MSFGDHLDELRARLIKALVGIAIGAAIGLTFGKEILGILCYPLFIAQIANGLPPQLQVLAPTAAFVSYLKIGLLSGLILAMPWVLYQIWMFVLSGLYSHERRFVRYLVPASSGLFAVGVGFLYLVVLPIVLHFFIRFNMSFGAPDVAAIASQEAADVMPDAPSKADPPDQFSHLPVLLEDPADPQPGWAWVNSTTRRLMVQTESDVLSLPMEVGKTPSAMQSQFAIDYYISFVLILALAFGITFETPIVVFFLAWTGLVPLKTMRQGRRYVLLGSVVAAAIITPPDVISQILLAFPMYLLFEVGLLAARTVDRKQVTAD